MARKNNSRKRRSANILAAPAQSGGDENLDAITRKLENKLRLSAHEHELKRKKEEWELRRKAATRLLWVFLAANAVSLIALVVAWITDYMSASTTIGYLEHRIFDKEVLMALMAATTIQLGAVALIIAKWLFPIE